MSETDRFLKIYDAALTVRQGWNAIRDAEDLEAARAIATAALEDYADFDTATWKRFKENGIWNDDAAVQAALCAIKMARSEFDGFTMDPLADLVARFSVALLDKMKATEAKYGYSDAWQNPNWHDDLVRDLQKHVDKGDSRDVAAYCAFAWHHGWSVAPEEKDDVEGWTEVWGES